MPHKRAKRSVRAKQRLESGGNEAPAKKAIESEEIPKSVARVLNAARIQQDWAERKRKSAEDSGESTSRKRRRRNGEGEADDGASKKPHLRIMPGESMAHFNRRVEDSMRHSVREAMQASSARMRQVRKEETVDTTGHDPQKSAKGSSKPHGRAAREASESEDEDTRPVSRTRIKEDKPKEFEKLSTSAPKRLNDIVQAPPEIKKLPRKAKKLVAQGGAKKGDGAKSLSEGVLSMAQKAMLEEERERAIRLYREMKKGKGT